LIPYDSGEFFDQKRVVFGIINKIKGEETRVQKGEDREKYGKSLAAIERWFWFVPPCFHEAGFSP